MHRDKRSLSLSRAKVFKCVQLIAVSLRQGTSLKAKVLRGGTFLGAGSLLEQLARFARTMILVRLIAPEAFGMMAVVLSTASVVDTLTDLGAREAVVQHREGDEPRYLYAAWWLTLARGLALYIVIFATAPLVSRFYGNVELSGLLRVALLSLVFGSSFSPSVNRAIKRMEFSRLAMISHGGAIFGIAITITMSIFVRNVWALAIGYCSENASRCILSYVLLPSVPKQWISREAFREVTKFSKGMFGLSFLNLIFSRADVFVLGKVCSASDLGIYTLAIYLVQTPVSFVMNLLGQTLLPAFSQISEDSQRTSRILYRVQSAIIGLGMPAVALVLLYGRPMLSSIYGFRYSKAAGPLAVAAFVAVLNLLNGQITTIFYALGRPHFHRISVAIMAGTMALVTYPFIKRFGLLGGQLACLLAISLGYLYQLVRLHRTIELKIIRLAKVCLSLSLLSAFVGIVGMGLRQRWQVSAQLATLCFGIGSLILTYLLIATILFGVRFGSQYATPTLDSYSHSEQST